MTKCDIQKLYIIISDEGYWNNDIGWCGNFGSATRFNYFDEDGNVNEILLPIGFNVRWTWADESKKWRVFA